MDLKEKIAELEAEVAVARTNVALAQAELAGLEAQRQALIDASGADVVADEAVDFADLRKDRAILAVLADADEPMSLSELLEEMHRRGRPNETKNGLSVYLQTLLAQNSVARPARGRYKLSGA